MDPSILYEYLNDIESKDTVITSLLALTRELYCYLLIQGGEDVADDFVNKLNSLLPASEYKDEIKEFLPRYLAILELYVKAEYKAAASNK